MSKLASVSWCSGSLCAGEMRRWDWGWEVYMLIVHHFVLTCRWTIRTSQSPDQYKCHYKSNNVIQLLRAVTSPWDTLCWAIQLQSMWLLQRTTGPVTIPFYWMYLWKCHLHIHTWWPWNWYFSAFRMSTLCYVLFSPLFFYFYFCIMFN